MSIPASPAAVAKEQLADCTAELDALSWPAPFSLTPAQLPGSMFHAISATWRAFRRGAEVFIAKNDGDLHRLVAALRLPEHRIPLWDCLPPQHWCLIARPDVILSGGHPVIVDINATSQAGDFALHDMILRAQRNLAIRQLYSWAGTPRYLMGHYADIVRRFMTRDDGIVAVSYFADEDIERPNPNGCHYKAHVDEFRRVGLMADIAHVEALETSERGVFHGGLPVGLIHRFFSPGINNPAQVAEFTRIAAAARAELVAVLTSPWGEALTSKATIAVLSDERFTDGLDPSLATALSQAVPWTRIIEERHTLWRGERIHLAEWTIRNRERLVLKPAFGFRGNGVMIGRETTPGGWAAQVNSALTADEPWVVQELIIPDYREVNFLDASGELCTESGPVTYGAFILDGEFAGAVCQHGRRGYADLVINSRAHAIPSPVYWAGDAYLDVSRP